MSKKVRFLKSCLLALVVFPAAALAAPTEKYPGQTAYREKLSKMSQTELVAEMAIHGFLGNATGYTESLLMVPEMFKKNRLKFGDALAEFRNRRSLGQKAQAEAEKKPEAQVDRSVSYTPPAWMSGAESESHKRDSYRELEFHPAKAEVLSSGSR